ncbi:hypothetical protein WDH52_23970 [Streptomyces sp. TRM70308]|uniref:hypothetical protein n=1 Tax=Streptomyces sp. TRM70308 TaxID=3131932 RepID=UPI003D0749F2
MWEVDRTTAVLRNTVTDADGDMANVTFEVYTVDANGEPKSQVDLTDDNPYGVLVSDYVASGETAEVSVPYGKLKPGTNYLLHTSAYDGSLYETSWSPWSKFRTRDRAVDITLPEPDKNAPKVNLADYQEPQEARSTVPNRSAQLSPETFEPSEDPQAAEKHCTTSPDGEQMVCGFVGEPGGLTKQQTETVDKRLRSARATDLVDWCTTSGTPAGKDWITRTEGCLKKRTPFYYQRHDLVNGKPVFRGRALFASEIQFKLDQKSGTFQQQLAIVPIKFEDAQGGHRSWGNLQLTPNFTCSPECDTSIASWDGLPTWETDNTDLHSAYATFTHKWTGVSDVTSMSFDWEIEGEFVGEPDREAQAVDLGSSAPDLNVRCDRVSSTTPGCVYDAYTPTWVMNFKKYPAAVAHAWLIQSKLPNHPGSKAANKPMLFLPKASKNATNRDPDENRQVICPDGWATAHGNPDATTVPELTPNNSDQVSCDEFAYAATYNSGGMPAAEGGVNEVTSGDACVQTYATRVTQGEWHLYDDVRAAAPTWTEVCGRSAMSRWMNSGSMAGFPGNFSAAGKFRLLDKDEYWVAFPEFAHCDASRATVKCTVPKP